MSARIETLAIMTRDRPALLHRCLASWIAARAVQERRLSTVLFDDAPDRGARLQNLEVLRTLPTLDREVRVVGRSERASFVRALSERSGVDADLIRFALLGADGFDNTCGANRNAVLLETAGTTVLSVDDDTAHLSLAGPVHEGVTLQEGEALGEFDFADTVAQACARCGTEDEIDLVGAHERLLGSTLAEIRKDFHSPAPVASEVGGLLCAEETRVPVTQMGYVGDPGMDSPFAYLLLEEQSRERLLGSESAYRSACTRRAGSRRVNRFTVSGDAYCMSYALGLDNRAPLPPFFPVGRNSDGIWGLTRRVSARDTVTGQVPYAIFHAPAPPRHWAPDAVWRAPTRWRMAEFVTGALMIAGSPSRAGGKGIPALGGALVALASSPTDEVARIIQRARQHRETMRRLALERLLSHHGARPAFWADDVRRAIACSNELSADPEPPIDILPSRSPAERLAEARLLLLMFGRLLQAWPSLQSAARELREQGRSLSRTLGERAAFF